jgi:hypothetical protein
MIDDLCRRSSRIGGLTRSDTRAAAFQVTSATLQIDLHETPQRRSH